MDSGHFPGKPRFSDPARKDSPQRKDSLRISCRLSSTQHRSSGTRENGHERQISERYENRNQDRKLRQSCGNFCAGRVLEREQADR
jgi:hypothetical protein